MSYSLNYIEKNALREVQKYSSLSQDRIKDILARSLLFECFEHLYFSYNSETKEISHSKFQNDPYNIQQQGFCFSEFILKKELGLSTSDSYVLKGKIDYYRSYDEYRYIGNVNVGTLNRAELGMSIVNDKSKIKRLMFNYPLQFYGIYLNRLVHNESGVPIVVSCFSCESMEIEYEQYFNGKINLVTYVKQLVALILKENNCLLEAPLVQDLSVLQPAVINGLRDIFEYHCYSYYEPLSKERSLCLYFPAQKSRIESSDEIQYRSFVDNNRIRKRKIGMRLKQLREERGLTQLDLADASIVSLKQIGNIERGYCSRYHDTVSKLCRGLQVSVEYFYSDVE